MLTDLLAVPGWDVERVAAHLGVSAGKVGRWPDVGVPNTYVRRLRELTQP